MDEPLPSTAVLLIEAGPRDRVRPVVSLSARTQLGWLRNAAQNKGQMPSKLHPGSVGSLQIHGTYIT